MKWSEERTARNGVDPLSSGSGRVTVRWDLCTAYNDPRQSHEIETQELCDLPTLRKSELFYEGVCWKVQSAHPSKRGGYHATCFPKTHHQNAQM